MFEQPKPVTVKNHRSSQKNSNLGEIFLQQSGVKKSSELRTAFSPKREADILSNKTSSSKKRRNKESPKSSDKKKVEADLTDYYLLAAASEMEQKMIEMEKTNSLAQKQLDELKLKKSNEDQHLIPKPIKSVAQFLKLAQDKSGGQSLQSKTADIK